MNDRTGVVMVDRIRRIKQLIEAFDSGDMNACKAVSLIEEVAAGEHERIVHVGNKTHNPEVQS